MWNHGGSVTPVLFQALWAGLLLAAVGSIGPSTVRAQGYLSLSCPGAGVQAWNNEGNYAGDGVGEMGTQASACYGNVVEGLTSVSSFAYYLYIYAGGDSAPAATAYIFNAQSWAQLASTSITLPTGGSQNYLQVVADFGAPQALNPSTQYVLAFCANPSSGDAQYEFAVDDTNRNPLGFAYCSASESACVSSGGNWYQSGNFPYTLISDISYVCASPSPSPTPSHTPTPSRTPTASPSSSPSTSPTPSTTPGASLSSTPSNPPTPSSTASVSPSPSATASPSASPSPTSSSTPTSSPTASVSGSPSQPPSPSSSPIISPILNVNARFGADQPQVNLIASLKAAAQELQGTQVFSSNSVSVV